MKIDPKIFVSEIWKHYKNEKCHLHWDEKRPWTLLFAVILSAQCTDEMVNRVTPLLFKELKDLKSFTQVPVEEIEQIIRPTGFFHNKAKSIQQCAGVLLEKYKGDLPDTMEELTKLPGVGRKTANVILWNVFAKNIGFTVDTHVSRISQRTGLTKQKTPEKIEQDLMKQIPQEKWGPLSHMIGQFGRDFCTARKPKCEKCFLQKYCPKIGILKN